MNCEAELEPPELGQLIDLNQSCFCLPLDRPTINADIIRRYTVNGLETLLAERPNLFAATGVFVSSRDIADMQSQIDAIEVLAQLASFHALVSARQDNCLASIQTQTRGLLMGYDFHITADGPRLIEVNTNAGGAFLVSAAETSPCGGARPASHTFAQMISNMFASEWLLSGQDRPLRTIAIVDDNPAAQYLYPDLLIARALLGRSGFEVFICAPEDLTYDGTQLRMGSKHIDLVYNRLTDFHLEEPGNNQLLAAYLADKVVLSPAPRHHALYADKKNLMIMSDPLRLKALGLPSKFIHDLSSVPETISVSASNAEALWSSRRDYFFKPAAGFGSRATYRGAKLTRRVWDNILEGDYVAQAFVAPALRGVAYEDEMATLKYDVRFYMYAGKPLLMAARVYQGQTTNFRTPGGGFAPIIPVTA